MRVIESRSLDAEFNLEEEKRLLSGFKEDILLLYINSPSVIVGRNQSVEAEADVDYCRRCGIKIVRRISGGGAVYHDEGNINYSFIMNNVSRTPLDYLPLQSVRKALLEIGVETEVGARGELLAGGRKISGTASFSGKGRTLFHGTLLHRTDLEVMNKALRGDPMARGKKIASVPAEVMNLSEFPRLDYPTGRLLGELTAYFRSRCE